VVVRRLAAFRQRYGPGPLVVGTFTGSLDDAGERIALTAASGGILADFGYDTKAPWPEGLAGYSLVRRDHGMAPGGAANWRLSVLPGGSPGAAESEHYADWKAGQGNPADDSDADGDGLPALVEYAIGGSLSGHDALRLPVASAVPPTGLGEPVGLELSYVRQRGRDDVHAVIRRSADLKTWSPAPLEMISNVGLPDGSERITVRTQPGSVADSRTFLQIGWELRP
jgi:hypothetical protein